MRHKGKLTSWNDEKGFGFITSNDGHEVFVHITSFPSRKRRPKLQQELTYTLSADNRGRTCAIQIILSKDPVLSRIGTFSFLLACFFLVLVAGLVVADSIPLLSFILYLLLSVLTFSIYAYDKAAAKKGSRRTPENRLHLLALLGGWPGALIAQQKLRHKSKKQPFRFIFWLTVVLNCAAFFWLVAR
ncbi:MAG: DUF1294 domain-containing protein [Candidatus Electrothrix sp. AR3]|nr:DUF1294 domain-containing protein [Candidatus Electrothrix sp. AR3]